MFLKNRVVFGVRHNVHGKVTVHFKPLSPFSPICDVYNGPHLGTISTATCLPWIVEGTKEAQMRVHEVVINDLEVE